MEHYLRDHPLVALQFRVRQEYLNDPDTPWSQVALRYTSEGSPTRNDIQVLLGWFAEAEGEVPDAAAGMRLAPALENATTAGQLRLAANDPYVQPELSYSYLDDPGAGPGCGRRCACSSDCPSHRLFQG